MKKRIPTRVMLVFGTFFLSLLLYIDRACISAAKIPISDSLGFSDKQMGWVLSAFALGYALFQTPSGMLADRLGPRKILTTIVILWSVFTALTAATWNYASMLVVRFLFGASEAGAFPGISRAVYSWYPLKERGLVTGINFSGSRLGAAFALPLVAWLIHATGWRITFVILGIIGILWAIFWFFWFRNTPEEHKGISEEEKNYIMNNRQQTDITEKAGIRMDTMLKSGNMWLAMLQYFASNFTFFFTLTWLFPHLQTKYSLEIVEAGFYASAPLIGGALGNWFSGWLVDVIYKKGNWKMSRRIPAIAGFVLVIIGLLGSLHMETVTGAVLFLTLAIFGADMTLSPSWSFCVDIGRRNSGAVSGTMNMAGNLGSFITALAFPYLQAWTGSEEPFFYTGATLAFIAIVSWEFMHPNKPILNG
ncbi:MFS transporter [Mariniphaga sp.]|uniref:MFS transporter n=1 Tax=Mariniphaga sp. TaxID=1954475 RepID=UPI00356B265F